MIDAQLNDRVLLDHELHEHRLVASMQAIELHKLIIGINSASLGDISVTVAGHQLLARGHGTESWRSRYYGHESYSRSYARHEFALKDLHLLVTQGFLNNVLLRIRKFGIEGGHELVHFFVRSDLRIASDRVINELSVLIPPNRYHMNPIRSWTRINPHPGSRPPEQDTTLFNEADMKSSRRQVRLPLKSFRDLPQQNFVLVKSNGEDRWRFRNVYDNGTLVDMQREDWFRTLYKQQASNLTIEEYDDSFSSENLPELSERALTVLADREVHR